MTTENQSGPGTEDENLEMSFENAFAELTEDEPPVAGEETPPAVEATDGTPGEEDETPPAEDDIWANASEAQRAAHEEIMRERDQWKHQYRSEEGRVSAFQRKINELTAEKEKAAATPPATPEPAADETDEELEEFKRIYPEIAGVLDKQSAAVKEEVQRSLAAGIEPVNETLKKLQEHEEERQLRVETERVTEAYPEWRKTVKTPKFAEFMRSAPPQLRVNELFNSGNADDAIFLLEEFDKLHGKQDGADDGEGEPTTTESTDSITQRRQRQLQQATELPASKGTGRKPVGKDDFEGAFAAYAARK